MRKIYPDFPYTEIQLLWLKTLENRNRKFRPEQTAGCLHNADDDGFCCLGVASQLMMDLNLLIAEWEGEYCFDERDDNGEPHPEAKPHGFFKLNVIGEGGPYDELLPITAQKIMNLRSNGGDPVPLNNLTEYPNDASDDIKDRDCEYVPPTLTDLNDGGISFEHIAVIIRMFPHFYFDNSGHPTEEIYRTDIFTTGFDPIKHRARFFK